MWQLLKIAFKFDVKSTCYEFIPGNFFHLPIHCIVNPFFNKTFDHTDLK